ncbi:hypothetical protein PRUPE_2G070200 [Prunus persica]|uniref:Uncharacterized protein n=1 Tax=Prunus persica TaxID=3760 RepID=A0A251QCD4_PRUPE|nr:hypothetical protein PRUPE_2G070200 [Prunus persica]
MNPSILDHTVQMNKICYTHIFLYITNDCKSTMLMEKPTQLIVFLHSLMMKNNFRNHDTFQIVPKLIHV